MITITRANMLSSLYSLSYSLLYLSNKVNFVREKAPNTYAWLK